MRPTLLLFVLHTLLTKTAYSDWLVGNATAQSTLVPTANLTNGTTFSGQTSNGGYVYQTDVQYVSGFLSNTSSGINHYLSVGANGTNAVDGLVAMMSVKILTNPSGPTQKSSCVLFVFTRDVEDLRRSPRVFFFFFCRARPSAGSSLFSTFVGLVSMLSAALSFA